MSSFCTKKRHLSNDYLLWYPPGTLHNMHWILIRRIRESSPRDSFHIESYICIFHALYENNSKRRCKNLLQLTCPKTLMPESTIPVVIFCDWSTKCFKKGKTNTLFYISMPAFFLGNGRFQAAKMLIYFPQQWNAIALRWTSDVARLPFCH